MIITIIVHIIIGPHSRVKHINYVLFVYEHLQVQKELENELTFLVLNETRRATLA